MKPLVLAIFLALIVPANGQSPADSVRTGQSGGVQRLADSVATSMASSPGQQTRKIRIVKKELNYSGFVALAIGMMAFIALIMTAPQTYNPSE